jgi:ABC-type Na+ transport system ATPase subunit NatA
VPDERILNERRRHAARPFDARPVPDASPCDLIAADHVVIPPPREARKPMFALKPADGAIGGHAAQDCYRDFRALAREIAGRAGVALPWPGAQVGTRNPLNVGTAPGRWYGGHEFQDPLNGRGVRADSSQEKRPMHRDDPDVAVAVHGLAKRYGKKQVLTGLDLIVPRGSTTALLGQNGAGKSTLLKILTGFMPRDGGRVSVLGFDPKKQALAVKERIGYVAHTTALNPMWRVSDAIGLVKAIRKKRWDDAEERRLIGLFALHAKAKVGTLSKGERAKLSLLLALGHRPELLVLDEPASGLDPVVRREVLDAIHEEGRTVLVASHRMDDVQRLADRVAFCAAAPSCSPGRRRSSDPAPGAWRSSRPPGPWTSPVRLLSMSTAARRASRTSTGEFRPRSGSAAAVATEPSRRAR